MNPIDFSKLADQFTYNPNDPLLFNSSFFLLFFTLFFSVYLFTYKHKQARVLLFTLFSLYFFYKACGWYFIFILLSAVVDFALSNLIYISRSQVRKKTLLLCSIVLNLALLFTFKYTDFFIQLYNEFCNGELPLLHLILPVGISFYTFENLSYTIDVYRGEFKPVNNFIDYCFFLTFFPKLMMGPIVRAKDFIPQIRQNIQLSKTDVAKGLFLVTSGLFKKVVISDFLSLHLVDKVFEAPGLYTGLECLMGVYAYALVIYCDFSGYSDMAIGMAKWMGFDIPMNFDSPYKSASITEFWRRWHISLSSWLRDYLYIPLGGNKKGKIRQYVNLLLTMLLGGFWHGASLNFIVWGGMHGLSLGFDKLKNKILFLFPFNFFSSKGWRFICIFLTFQLVCFCWIYFKAENFETAATLTERIIHALHPELLLPFLSAYWQVLLIMILGFVLHFCPDSYSNWFILKLSGGSFFLKLIWLLLMLFIVVQFKSAESVLPVYLQF